MIELHFIGYTADLHHLVLDLDPDGNGRYLVPVDGDLFATLDVLREERYAQGLEVGVWDPDLWEIEVDAPAVAGDEASEPEPELVPEPEPVPEVAAADTGPQRDRQAEPAAEIPTVEQAPVDDDPVDEVVDELLGDVAGSHAVEPALVSTNGSSAGARARDAEVLDLRADVPDEVEAQPLADERDGAPDGEGLEALLGLVAESRGESQDDQDASADAVAVDDPDLAVPAPTVDEPASSEPSDATEQPAVSDEPRAAAPPVVADESAADHAHAAGDAPEEVDAWAEADVSAEVDAWAEADVSAEVDAPAEVDESSRDTAEERPRTAGGVAIPEEARLGPKEIQALLRAGKSAKSVATSAGTDLAWVQRWLEPIKAEQEQVTTEASAARLTKRGDESPLGLADAVAANLAARGLDPDAVRWAAVRPGEGPWKVTARYHDGDRARVASWTFDRATQTLRASSTAARELGWAPRAGSRR